MMNHFSFTPSKKQLSDFSQGMIFISMVLTFVSWYFQGNNGSVSARTILGLGSALVVFFIFCRLMVPQAAKPVYIIWVGSSKLASLIIGPILLTLIFLGVIFPIGILSRSFGKVWLQTDKRDSYWQPLPPFRKQDYKRLF